MAPGRSVNNSERDEIQDRLIQNEISCMITDGQGSIDRMTICNLLGSANLPLPDSSAFAELLRLCHPWKFEMSLRINCHDCLATLEQEFFSLAEISSLKRKVAHGRSIGAQVWVGLISEPDHGSWDRWIIKSLVVGTQ